MKAIKIILIAALIAVLAGGLIFVIALGAGGWELDGISSLSVTNLTYEEKAENPINKIVIDYDNVSVKINEGESFSVSYPKLLTSSGEDASQITLTDSDGTLTIKERTLWHKNIGFNFTKKELTITVPKGRMAEIKLEIDNGDVKANSLTDSVSSLYTDIDNGSAILDTVRGLKFDAEIDNGSVYLKNLDTGSIKVSLDNGSVHLENSTLASALVDIDNGDVELDGSIKVGTLSVEIDNGDVDCDEWLDADSISISIDNGDIDLSLVGNRDDYTVFVSRSIGESNVSSGGSGDRRLTLELEIGSIEVDFAS